MPADLPSYLDRRRANSFGAEAGAYDEFRPRYPQALIADLVTERGVRVLDVGAGTGIASNQLQEAGAQVLAVEPDERMAEVARGKGIDVEVGTFEEWDPAGRVFDLVVFGQSFHWVDPAVALPKINGLLAPGGRLVPMWNRIVPIQPSKETIESILAGTRGKPEPIAGHRSEERALGIFSEAGFDVERRVYHVDVRYTAEQYVNMQFTFSQQIILDAAERAELRRRLLAGIGEEGVVASNDAVALISTVR